MKKILFGLIFLMIGAAAYEDFTERFLANRCDVKNVSGTAVINSERELPSGYVREDVCAASKIIVKNNIADTRRNFSRICQEVENLVSKEGGDVTAAISRLKSASTAEADKLARAIDICYNDALLKESSMDVSIYSLGDFEVDGRACKGVLRVQGGIFDLQGFGECESVEIEQQNGNVRYSVVLSEKYKYQGRMPETYTFRGETKPF